MTRANFLTNTDGHVFHIDDPGGKAGGWYFESQEGPHGPYPTREVAEAEARKERPDQDVPDA